MVILFLNSLGTGEVVLILFAVLILFGSKGIPDFAKNLGKGMREIRNASNEIKRDIQNSALEMRKDLKMDEYTKELREMGGVPEFEEMTQKNDPPKIESKEETTDKASNA